MTKRWIPLVFVLAGTRHWCMRQRRRPGGPRRVPTPHCRAVPTSQRPDGYSHPTSADEVVVSYAELGGFTPREFAFGQPPAVLIAGDGRLFSPGAQIEIYPGPLLPAVQVQTITEADIQQILAAADQAELVRRRRLRDRHEHRRRHHGHRHDQRQRRDLGARGVRAVDRRPGHDRSDAGTSGPVGVHQPAAQHRRHGGGTSRSARRRCSSRPSTRSRRSSSTTCRRTAPTASSRRWRSGPPTSRSASPTPAECTVVPASEVGDLLAAANQLTFFSDDGTTYQLLARPALPGSQC